MGIIKYSNIEEEMVFRNFVEAGRAAVINYGEDYGKLVVIVDFADSKKMLVDGVDFPRAMYPLRRLTLTKFTLPILRGARTSTLVKAWKKFDLTKKFAESRPAQKMEQANKRASLNDMERFSVMINRKRRSFAVRKLAAKQLKGGKKGPVKKAVEKAKGKK